MKTGLLGVLVASLMLSACYQSKTDGKRLYVTNRLNGDVKVVEGEEQFVPTKRVAKREETDETQPITRGSGSIPNTRLNWQVQTMWANNAARAKLSITDSKTEPSSFAAAFYGTANYNVRCVNAADFTIAESPNMNSHTFTAEQDNAGSVGSFVIEVALPLTYEAYKQVTSCTIVWR